MKIKRKFEQLWHTAQKYYNDTNCCTVIAVATVLNQSYGKARFKMQKAGREHRKGTIAFLYHEVIRRSGYNLDWVDGYKGHHVKTMGSKLSQGTYLVQVRGHVLAMVDGVINDWSKDRSLRVITVYKVTKNEG